MTMEEKIIIAFAKEADKNRKILDSLKRSFAKKESKGMVKNSQLLEAYHKLVKEKRIKKDLKTEYVLRIRKVRSLSGIVIVSVLTKPYPCPGKCIYCPQQDGAPKSYLREEPAVARAIKCDYQPYKQVQVRINALEATGHPTDKEGDESKSIAYKEPFCGDLFFDFIPFQIGDNQTQCMFANGRLA